MTLNPMTSHHGQTEQIGAERADRMTAWWPGSLSSQINSREDRNRIEAGIAQLSAPCEGAWLMARVLALLQHDFASDVPESIRRIEAADWAAALGALPQWAVEKACRWWRSDANPDRRKRPMVGDIQARTKVEMGVLHFAAVKVREYDKGYAARMVEVERQPPTQAEMDVRREHAARILARCSYTNHMAAVTEGPKPPPDPTPPTPEEIAETMAIVNAKSAAWAQEKARQDAVARELQAMGLDVLLQKPAKAGALS